MVLKTIVIDRDGCLNKYQEGQYVSEPEGFVLFDDVNHLFQKCGELNINLAVATNQRGLALGKIEKKKLDQMHEKLRHLADKNQVSFSIHVCPHFENACECRKPKTGLLEEILIKYNNEIEDIIFIGDQITDYLAANALKCKFIGLDRHSSNVFEGIENIRVVNTLYAAFECLQKDIELC